MLCFKRPYLLAISLLVSVLYDYPAQALGIQFDLVEQTQLASSSANTVNAPLPPNQRKPTAQPSRENFAPLSIPPAASHPPIHTKKYSFKQPDNVITTARALTPPPHEALPTSRVLHPDPLKQTNKPIALSFKPDPSAIPSPLSPALTKTPQQAMLPNWIYAGGSDSLVARVIGHAEGTRTPSGKPTRAYYGHTDPGNGVWNLGTFSYQHGAPSPQAADQKQLTRLKKQGKIIAKQAMQARLTLTLGEILNGLDLANQSPEAALEHGGYVDRLVQAREQKMENRDAIVWARTYAYLDPNTQRWNAPGLGNTLPSIQRDQDRRHESIAQAFSHYQAQQPIDQPLGETLPTLAIALVQPPLLKEVADYRPAVSQGQEIPQQTPARPITFKVAEALHPTHQTAREIPTEPSPLTPNLEPKVSPASTISSSKAAPSQAHTHPDTSPIRSETIGSQPLVSPWK